MAWTVIRRRTPPTSTSRRARTTKRHRLLAHGQGRLVDAFWSFSVYNVKSCFEPNTENAYTLNDLTAKKGDDGSVTSSSAGARARPPTAQADYARMERYGTPLSATCQGLGRQMDIPPSSARALSAPRNIDAVQARGWPCSIRRQDQSGLDVPSTTIRLSSALPNSECRPEKVLAVSRRPDLILVKAHRHCRRSSSRRSRLSRS